MRSLRKRFLEEKGKGGFEGESEEQLGGGKLTQNPSGLRVLELGIHGSFQ